MKIFFATPLIGEQSKVALPMLGTVRLAGAEVKNDVIGLNRKVIIYPLDVQAQADKVLESVRCFLPVSLLIAIIAIKKVNTLKLQGRFIAMRNDFLLLPQ